MRGRLANLTAGRGRWFFVMMGSIALALPLMLIFEHPITRAFGVVLLFTFIAAGVFAIAEDAFLDAEEDDIA